MIVFLVLETWLNVIQSFAVSLFGRTWLLNVVQFSVIGAFMGVCALGAWASRHPQSLSAVLRGVEIAAWVPVAAKVGLAGTIIRALSRCRAASAAQIILWTFGWLFLLATQFATLVWLVPRLRHSLIALTAGLVLSLPYNRLIAMPLAWHHKRHQS